MASTGKGLLKKQHPKKSISKLRDDMSWIVEGIVAYLRSPTWTVPVLNFIEDHCSDFVDTEENKFEFTEIHQNYKKLVESLLAVYMKELQLTEEQFSEACSIHNMDIANSDSKFKYIWAGDDFILFKRLMIKYNAEVQREALSMLQRQHITGSSKADERFEEEDTMLLNQMLKKSKSSLKEKKLIKKQEESDMELAIKFSKMEMERLNGIVEEERRLLEEAIRLSLASSESSQSSNFKPSAESNPALLTKPVQIGNFVDKLPEGFTASSIDSPPVYTEPAPTENRETVMKNGSKSVLESKSISKSSHVHTDLPPLKTQKEISSSDAAQAWLDKAMKGITESPIHATNESNSKKHDSIDPDELAKRKAYLQKQRDKLLALKRKERDKELSEYNEQQKECSSSKAVSSVIKKVDEEEEKRLASRRSIAERLKREVVNKK